MSDTKLRVRKATGILREDHQYLKRMLSDFEELRDNAHQRRQELFEEIRKEITVHARIEEEIFYPAIEAGGDEEVVELVKQAREEHRIVKTLLEELSEITPESDDFDAKMKVLKESVLRHAEEEQEDLFPCFDELDQEDQERISETLAARKQELTREE
jgi:iron-sulfur cluster repair protein YtfE (RIC family)